MTRSLVLWVCLLALLGLFVVSAEEKEENLYRESEHEVVYRVARQARPGRNKGVGSECRYKKGPWQECDSASNTQTRTLTLKRGDAGCDQTKVMNKKCKKACRYEKGEWNLCQGGVRTRTDKLKAKSDSNCEAVKTVSKPCKNAAGGAGAGGGGGASGGPCRYDRNVPWSNCDPVTGKKSKVMRLTDGPSDCPATKALEKNCRKGKGRDKNGSDDD